MDLNEISEALVMRLQYANLKVQLGWTDRTLPDVENTYHRRFRYRKESPVVSMLDAYVEQQRQRRRRAANAEDNGRKRNSKLKKKNSRSKQEVTGLTDTNIDGKDHSISNIGLTYADFWRSHTFPVHTNETIPNGSLNDLKSCSKNNLQTLEKLVTNNEIPTTGLGPSRSMQEDLAQMIAQHHKQQEQKSLEVNQEEKDFIQYIPGSPMIKSTKSTTINLISNLDTHSNSHNSNHSDIHSKSTRDPLTPPPMSSPTISFDNLTTPKRPIVLPRTPPPSLSTNPSFTPPELREISDTNSPLS